MHCEQIRSTLADFLSGEMSSADAALVQDHLARCGNCEREVQGLRAAAELLKEGALPLTAAQQRAAAIKLPLPEERRFIRSPYTRTLGLLRYAAVIAISFGAGYLMRPDGGGKDRRPDPDSKEAGLVLAKRYEAASRSYPEAASMSKGLLALASMERR